jgi:hypothetical protein
LTPGIHTASDFPPLITSNIGSLAVRVTPEAPSLFLIVSGLAFFVGAAQIRSRSSS